MGGGGLSSPGPLISTVCSVFSCHLNCNELTGVAEHLVDKLQ